MAPGTGQPRGEEPKIFRRLLLHFVYRRANYSIVEVGAQMGHFPGFGSKAKQIVGWNRLWEIGFPKKARRPCHGSQVTRIRGRWTSPHRLRLTRSIRSSQTGTQQSGRAIGHGPGRFVRGSGGGGGLEWAAGSDDPRRGGQREGAG